MLKNHKGITLVELLSAMAVASVLAMVIYTFIMFSSKTMRKITAMQVMQQESSIISEIFMRQVRNGAFVSVDTEKGPPEFDTTDISRIIVRDADSSELTSFAIENEYFIRDWHLGTDAVILSENLWIGGDVANRFTVFQNGDHVDFYLNLHRTVGDDTIYVSQMVGDVRCKN